MALSGLFPKGFFDDPTPSAPSQSSASTSDSPVSTDPMDRMPGRDSNGKLKLPPVALYVSGAALALTVALTAMIVPYVKAAGPKTATPPTFISHFNAHRIPRPGRVRPSSGGAAGLNHGIASSSRASAASSSKSIFESLSSSTRFVSAPRGGSASASGTTIPIPSTSGSTTPISTVDIPLAPTTSPPPAQQPPTPPTPPVKPAASTFANLIPSVEIPDSDASDNLLASRRFNTAEERRLYGTSEADGEDAKNGAVDPLMGFYALAIATGIVGASTGLGVWVTAKLMGVDNMDDFATRIKAGLARNMPALAKVMDEAKEVERRDTGELDGEGVWKHWSETILGEEGAERAKETEL